MNKKTVVASLVVIVLVGSAFAVGYYLTSQSKNNPRSIPWFISGFYLGGSRILVVSADASYGNYPGPTVTPLPFSNSSFGTATHGEPCVIINVTLRNDYSAQNPAPNPRFEGDNSTMVYVGLTGKLFSGESQINATDITNALPIASVGTNKAFTSLNYGESTTLSIYLATDNLDVSRFELVLFYVGLLLPP